MQIRTRFSISADGYVTTPDGRPALVADPSFVSGQSHGLRDGMRLTPALSTDTRLTLESERPLPGDSVEITYACA